MIQSIPCCVRKAKGKGGCGEWGLWGSRSVAKEGCESTGVRKERVGRLDVCSLDLLKEGVEK